MGNTSRSHKDGKLNNKREGIPQRLGLSGDNHVSNVNDTVSVNGSQVSDITDERTRNNHSGNTDGTNGTSTSSSGSPSPSSPDDLSAGSSGGLQIDLRSVNDQQYNQLPS